jgi:hypothetical protein
MAVHGWGAHACRPRATGVWGAQPQGGNAAGAAAAVGAGAARHAPLGRLLAAQGAPTVLAGARRAPPAHSSCCQRLPAVTAAPSAGRCRRRKPVRAPQKGAAAAAGYRAATHLRCAQRRGRGAAGSGSAWGGARIATLGRVHARGAAPRRVCMHPSGALRARARPAPSAARPRPHLGVGHLVLHAGQQLLNHDVHLLAHVHLGRREERGAGVGAAASGGRAHSAHGRGAVHGALPGRWRSPGGRCGPEPSGALPPGCRGPARGRGAARGEGRSVGAAGGARAAAAAGGGGAWMAAPAARGHPPPA